MLRQSQLLSARGYGWLRYVPTNLLINAILSTHRGGPEVLYLLVLLFGWDACKFLGLGPVSLGLLIKVRRGDAKDRHNAGDQGERELPAVTSP